MKKEFIILLLLLQTILNLNSINANTSTSIVKELQKNLYVFNSKEYQKDKDTLNEFINSININDKEILQNLEKVKNELFIISVFFKNKKGVLIALNLGADINLKYKISPISISIINNEIEIIKILVDYGISLNQIDDTSYSPIFWAIYTNNEKVFELLKESGADLSYTLKNRKTPMQAAIETENINLIKSLEKKKIYIDDNYKKELKTLKNKEIVRILVK
ncbi:ankyrin repeat domain-containing protein [Borreliella californiensis]|uniref:Ankyrin repeat domain-containing protein n=1 Tax=Borreliella californiensis TaxID=373543 RepID=A0A7X0DR57_9SPIR|nr:ankyrin repeat domain-containing protein [Borreliella californiensis]MBB6212972.1 ankyrin repeat protein [Borreliella californiensis]WKC91685.1 ankyrin repeat domain-containing protein [Borreliella californiensis]WNY70441.1 ankyrin repeat domain-containing protein [Borreliella californiensis]